MKRIKQVVNFLRTALSVLGEESVLRVVDVGEMWEGVARELIEDALGEAERVSVLMKIEGNLGHGDGRGNDHLKDGLGVGDGVSRTHLLQPTMSME